MADPSPPAGWPYPVLSGPPPSISDRQTAPTADDLLPQVLALAPRGPAWGTDEMGDGNGASPVQLSVWRGIAAWVADLNVREAEVAAQAFPSAITIALEDWETELGLPDQCMPAGRTIPQRVAAVRARFGALGGASPAYFANVAQALGYAVTIEEPTQFLVDVSECVAFQESASYFTCDDSECGDDGDPIEGYAFPASADPGDEVAGGALTETYFTCDDSECGEEGDRVEGFSTIDPNSCAWQYWVMRVDAPPNTYFTCDDSECGDDGAPIEGYSPALDLECVMGRLSPQHCDLVFVYPD